MIISGRTVGADNNFHFTPVMACYSVLVRSKNRISKDLNSMVICLLKHPFRNEGEC